MAFAPKPISGLTHLPRNSSSFNVAKGWAIGGRNEPRGAELKALLRVWQKAILLPHLIGEFFGPKRKIRKMQDQRGEKIILKLSPIMQHL
jgi:hypothetical protein